MDELKDSQDPVFACLLTIQREGGHEELKVLLKELSRINLGVPSDIASQLSNSCGDEEMKSLLDSLAQVWSPISVYIFNNGETWVKNKLIFAHSLGLPLRF